ncbi:hypothetical protein [Microvirga alba]|uniref:Uncharacterized protein n=1 Tax=Microvirga alba TaxID=2791025 RepID=A0A931BNV3_9HYPH|nr:hypothetical protein [Microvirga alba]MBF9234706.1 hypothetical protein [Microvirga alba]
MLQPSNDQQMIRLAALKAKLSATDALADLIRASAIRDTSSDEPYENASALSGHISAALAMVEIILEDMGATA